MSAPIPAWAEGLEILRARQARLPQSILEAWAAPEDLEAAASALSRCSAVVTTGVGSSWAHAQYLAWLLRDFVPMPAWEVPTGSFLGPPPSGAREQALVVFSQGLSPNARFPLAHIQRYRAVVLVTAATTDSEDRASAVGQARQAGAMVVQLPCAPEYEVLLRLTGPMVGYVTALRLAREMGARLDVSRSAGAELGASVQEDTARLETLLSGADASLFTNPITLVSTDGYAALSHNLRAKVLEGMFLPWPGAVDALEFSHGTLQEASGRPRTFVALKRGGALETALFARVQQTLEPQHRWLELEARLPTPLAVMEHEALFNVLVLRAIALRRLNQRAWPAKGRDAPLYSVGSVEALSQEEPSPAPPAGDLARPSARLSDLTWPEVEAHIRAGRKTVVLPLGATEQHGPHLPLSVDSLIAEALAERFCLRRPEALQAPTLTLGCSAEHMAFAGTLSLSAATLRATLVDVIQSLRRHGFDHVVVFSAHGGNDALLGSVGTLLAEAARPAKVTVVHGVDRISEVWQRESVLAGAPPGAAGHHAGEFETSIISALLPQAVRWREVRPGSFGAVQNAQHLFYPSLRDHAPDGVVGDPTHAGAERAERYLAAWVDMLVDAYLGSSPRGSC